MTLQKRSGVALWRQVQMDLERRISDGSLVAGQQLPTEAALSERFGVNRHTVRRALAAMDARGLIRVEQGRGTFVREPVLAYRVSVRTRFGENLAAQSRVAARDTVDSVIEPATAEVAEALGLAPDARVVRIAVVGDSDGHRVGFSEHLFPADRFPGLIERFAEAGGVTLALAAFGVEDYRRQWTRVTARMPTAREAALLRQSRTRPVLVSESLNVDPDGCPIEYGLTRFNSDWVRIVFEP